MNETIRVKIKRSDGTNIDQEVPCTEYSTVLDLLDWLKAGPVPSLAYRASCRSGICGSCGVMVNGRPVLACETFASGFRKSGINIGPLAKLPVLRDLIVDTNPFLTQLRSALAWHLPQPSVTDGNSITKQTPAQLADYRQLSQCINCLLCYSACPQYVSPEQYIGPAAIVLAQRWSLDSRDEGPEQRFEALAEAENGIWPCTLDGSCTLVCPKGIDPKSIIGALQRQALGA